jgi:hypothetical protein
VEKTNSAAEFARNLRFDNNGEEHGKGASGQFVAISKGKVAGPFDALIGEDIRKIKSREKEENSHEKRTFLWVFPRE